VTPAECAHGSSDAFSPDAVLCDTGLPGMSGYEIARAIGARSHAGLESMALSGYAQFEDVRQGIDAGFDAHLVYGARRGRRTPGVGSAHVQVTPWARDMNDGQERRYASGNGGEALATITTRAGIADVRE
jgi:hypothetical protein